MSIEIMVYVPSGQTIEVKVMNDVSCSDDDLSVRDGNPATMAQNFKLEYVTYSSISYESIYLIDTTARAEYTVYLAALFDTV